MGVEASPVARYAAEFLGTFVLVFTIGCNVLSGQPVWGGVSIACALMVMIYALASSSGANFNPAVSLALSLAKKQAWKETGIYMACQMAGGLIAGACYYGMFIDAFKLGPTKGHTWWEAGFAETLYTFMLCFVVLNVATAKRDENNKYFGLAIGFVIVAGAYSGGSVSMGCFNPAVAFGIDISSLALSTSIKYGAIYTAFELLGAALAVGLFFVVRPEEKDPEKIKDTAPDQLPEPSDESKLVSELVGTYFLVLTVGLNVLSQSTAGALSIAASLMCMSYALASVSGAHFNPAVTVAILVRGGINGLLAAKYCAAQIIGGLLAAITYASMKGSTFALKPDPWHAALLGEFVFTFVLAFVALSVATTKPPLKEMFGFAIGMCVTLGGNAVGKISGGSLNPAVSIAISTSHIVNGGDFWVCIPYTLVECAAGAVAAAIFMVTHPSQMTKEPAAKEPTEATPLATKA
jgi:aquaporin Z